MKNISPISNELVQFIGDKKKHTTLFCIKHLLDWANSIPSEKPLNGSQCAAIEKIKNLPAKSFDKVIEHPAIEIWCANIIRTVRDDEELAHGAAVQLPIVDDKASLPPDGLIRSRFTGNECGETPLGVTTRELTSINVLLGRLFHQLRVRSRQTV